VYLLDAYQRLAFGGIHSFGTLVRSFLTDPPHAPMSTLTAMLGYALIGPYLWAAYAANVWMLGLFAAAVYLVARQNIDRIPSILAVALMLFVPAVHTLITEFRPDQGAGVILACALYWLVSADYPKATRPRRVAMGFLVVCAVMAKPTAIVATVPVLGLAAAIGILRPGYYSKSEAIYSVRAAILPVAVADGADFVILSRTGEHSNLPGSKFGAHTSSRLSTSADWRQITASGDYQLFAKAKCG
jgi:4-amino-4-deoxy-L-arabinose transferase-like glycosyltransferase